MAFPGAILQWLSTLAFIHPVLCSSVGAALAINAVYSPLQFARRALGLGRVEAAASCATDLRVIVSGLSGTGTRSIKQALDSVGHRCYHTDGLIAHGHLGSGLWVEDFASAPGDAAATDAALRAAVDEVLTLGYDCVVDAVWPYAARLARLYPSALVLHSERDSAEEWFRSFYTLNAAFEPAYGRPIRWFVDLRPYDMPLRSLGELPDAGNVTWRYPLPWVDVPAVRTAEQIQSDREVFIAAYDSQRARVESVAEHRLLVFNVKQGWPPLCEFLSLGTSCPEVPFPHVRRGLDLNFVRILLEFNCYAYPLVLPFLAFTAGASLWFAFVVVFGMCLLLRMLAKDFVFKPLFHGSRERAEALHSDRRPRVAPGPTIGGEELDHPRVEQRKKDSQVMKRVLQKMRKESLREKQEAERRAEGYIQRLPAHREDEAEPTEAEAKEEPASEDSGIDVD